MQSTIYFQLPPFNEDGILLSTDANNSLALLKLFLAHRACQISYKQVQVEAESTAKSVKKVRFLDALRNVPDEEPCVNFLSALTWD